MNTSSIASAFRAATAIALSASLSGGCYLMQSAGGQLSVMAKRRPISRVIADAHTGPAVRTQLTAVSAIRDFAVRELKLPDNGSYRQYADIGRAYVVWNVFAAPEFSLEPRHWCYPIAGCVSYHGYFNQKSAARYAGKLRARGFDVAVGGVAAYSTLGHFDDPILSSMIGWSDVQLAAIIFHELTHQRLYVANDSAFNEALATTVEEEGVRRWLKSQGRDRDLAAYDAEEGREGAVVALLSGARRELAALYRSGLPAEAMRARKREAFARLRAAFEELKGRWGGDAPYESWFAQGLNNAHLASVATYRRCVPGLRRELARADGDLARFFVQAGQLARLSVGARERRLCGA